MQNNDIFINKLKEAFGSNGLGDLLNNENSQKLCDFAQLLVETNKKYNLTSITDDDGIILKHFVDCASTIKHIKPNTSLIDIGCGAGFPSVPIAILRHDVKVTAIDSTEKKINFIKQVADSLSIKNIYPIAARAEDFAATARESFDAATSRAVSRLNILSELCIPFVKPGGVFIAMKSSKGEDEFSEASVGINKLGAKQASKENLILSFNGAQVKREIHIFIKEKRTPDQYPRNYSQIIKKPL